MGRTINVRSGCLPEAPADQRCPICGEDDIQKLRTEVIQNLCGEDIIKGIYWICNACSKRWNHFTATSQEAKVYLKKVVNSMNRKDAEKFKGIYERRE